MASIDATTPPQNLEAEESVLGAMMVSESAISAVLLDTRLRKEDFYRHSHRLIFGAALGLHDDSEPVDALTVSAWLEEKGELAEAGGKEAVSHLASTVPAAGNAAHYAKIVKANSLLRRLLETSHKVQKSVFEHEGEPQELLERAQSDLFKVATEDTTKDFTKLEDILLAEVTRLEELSTGKRQMTGTRSGFVDLDELLGGFQPGNMIVLAARPSIGKSALVVNIAENAALKDGKTVAFFSLEMSETELAHRFIASRARIAGDLLRKGKVSESKWPRVMKAMNELNELPLWLDDSSDLSMLELRAKCRRLATTEGQLGLVIVDYMQLMRPEDPKVNRVEQVGQISRGLKILAKELNVPVIGLSQLSRTPETRPDKRPILSDLRESGNIEQDADVVMFIYRDAVYNEEAEPSEAELIIAKHRNGPVGKVDLNFLGLYPLFGNPPGRGRDPGPMPPVEVPEPAAAGGDLGGGAGDYDDVF
ncbi:replicative DNA helicase [Thermoleophilia bacterium SCSIO 60948]|nr:replicative DNA helicase [Thermoleophilia bacterium SCSIO 60948]